MTNKKSPKFDTIAVHAGLSPEKWEGATLPPIYQSASHKFDTAEELSDVFAAKTPGFIYQRIKNPTNTALEARLTALEGGAGALVTASGMAAITAAVVAIASSGDEIVSGNSLFMSTYLLFTKVLPRFGIKAKLVETTNYTEWQAAASEKTKLFYVETIGNPKMDVPDLKKLSDLAHSAGAPLIVDNTLATPYLCKPFEFGADIVIHSTTKYFCGHGAAVGGVVIDSAKFEWDKNKYPDFGFFIDKWGKNAFINKMWREIHVNFGASQSPFHSYLTLLGVDTLALRMRRHLDNSVSIATFLDKHPNVKWVNYPGLENSPHHKLAESQFGGKGFGALITFGLADQKACFEFIRRLKLIYHLANLGDCKTLAIHPASSQYVTFDPKVRESLGIPSDMLRLSIGIEAAEDIIEDIDAALKGL